MDAEQLYREAEAEARVAMRDAETALGLLREGLDGDGPVLTVTDSAIVAAQNLVNALVIHRAFQIAAVRELAHVPLRGR